MNHWQIIAVVRAEKICLMNGTALAICRSHRTASAMAAKNMFGGVVQMDTAGEQLFIPETAPARDAHIVPDGCPSSEKMIWLRNIPIWRRNGCMKKTVLSRLIKCCLAAIGWCGGVVIKAMSGRRRSNPVSTAQGAPSAITNKCRLVTMTCKVFIRLWQKNGTPPKTGSSPQPTSFPAPGAKSGGAARKATTTRLASPAASTAAAAPFALAKKCWQGSTTWPPSTRLLPPIGIQRKTVLLPRHKSPRLLTKKFGGTVIKATTTKPSSPAALSEAAAVLTVLDAKYWLASMILPR